MKNILAIFFLVSFAACAYQAPPVIYESQASETSYVYPDLTLGCIENQAFPFVPKVFLIANGQRIVLIGPETGLPEFNTKEIREFNLPPGEHFLHIERWQLLGVYGGWKKIRKTEVIKVPVAQFEEGGWSRWSANYYGWRVIIYDKKCSTFRVEHF